MNITRQMRHYARYLMAGLGIGIVLASTLMAGFLALPSDQPMIDSLYRSSYSSPSPTSTPSLSQSSTPRPSPTFSHTPSSLPSMTALPSPTPTATPGWLESMILSGDIRFAGPLTNEQQLRLYSASLAFISLSPNQSRQTSSLIMLLPFSDPSTICGPLSIAILQRAEILDSELLPSDFFLINPDLGKDRKILSTAFPEQQYSTIRQKARLNQFDWDEFPLFPGDFIYLYAGAEGNFEHMLVVTRVDIRGRAYSVTNYNTTEGFIINEVLLYDPQDPTVGIFSQWTRRKDQPLGSTGFAGFEIWRRSGDRQ